MKRRRSSRARQGLTLIESVAAVASLGLVGTVGVAGVSEARRADAHANCSARLAAIGAGNGQFALANNDRMVGFTWQTGGNNSLYPDLNAQQATPGINNAHAAQAVDILRRGGRSDIAPVSSWVPDIGYATLVLADFQNRPLSDPFNVCPSHDSLNKWRRWPIAFDQGRFLPAQPPPGPTNKRWPYTGSYRLAAAAFDINQTVFTQAAVTARIANNTAHNLYTIPGNAALGPSAMPGVSFPSQKSHMADSNQRHLAGLHLFAAYPASTQPHLFFDGSVSTRVSQDAITPWTPNNPTAPWPSTFNYQPAAWEPGTQSGQASQSVQDRFYYTRNGLQGLDFN